MLFQSDASVRLVFALRFSNYVIKRLPGNQLLQHEPNTRQHRYLRAVENYSPTSYPKPTMAGERSPSAPIRCAVSLASSTLPAELTVSVLLWQIRTAAFQYVTSYIPSNVGTVSFGATRLHFRAISGGRKLRPAMAERPTFKTKTCRHHHRYPMRDCERHLACCHVRIAPRQVAGETA